MNRPLPGEFAPYYAKYIELVPDENILTILQKQMEEIKIFFSTIGEDKSKYRYADGKWSIREVLGHIIDGERIFAYRVLKFSRNDLTEIESFDQNSYVKNSNHDNILLESLAEEFENLRSANILLFKTFTDEMWQRTGIVNKNSISVRAMVYVMAGHCTHHLNVIKEKYL